MPAPFLPHPFGWAGKRSSFYPVNREILEDERLDPEFGPKRDGAVSLEKQKKSKEIWVRRPVIPHLPALDSHEQRTSLNPPGLSV